MSSSVNIPEDLDRKLLDAPWLGKKDQNGTSRLFKYAHTPDGASYILVTTDLTSIEVHIPPASEISSIPWSTEHSFLARTQELIQSSGFEEEEDEDQQLGLILDRLGEMMSASQWNDVQVLAETEEKEQNVLYLKADGFGWRFPLSPLNPTEHLQFIARHLISPLTNLVAQDRSIPIPSSTRAQSPFDPTVKLISDPETSRAIKRVSSSGATTTTSQSRSTVKAKPAQKSRSPELEVDVNMDLTSEVGSPTPRRPVRHAINHSQRTTKLASEGLQSPTKKSSLHPPVLSDSSSLAPSSSPPRSTPPPAPEHALTSAQRPRTDERPSPSSSLPVLSSTPVNSSPPPPPDDLPPSKKQKVEPPVSAMKNHNLNKDNKGYHAVSKGEDRSSPSLGSAMDFNPPSSSSRTSGGHTQSSQKSKKEREREEEEEMQRKIGEMKKKMEKGGTGRLGKRRLAR
ncbi:hypothetical protein I317_07081 [Kwoniella heveanensis CBS 569]|nr:hypothetical protein I317_07081 [Kwoniella heveanensis CBS 569]